MSGSSVLKYCRYCSQAITLFDNFGSHLLIYMIDSRFYNTKRLLIVYRNSNTTECAVRVNNV